ncbi:MAG: fibrillarin-like rRNA/tRNA 2'-O-methyltransferase [Candidatus Hodarchaeales archaeon]|jgi:fibrillarin-like rRNA methylase
MRIKDHYLPNVALLDLASESRIWPATVNLNPGIDVYGEKLYTDKSSKIEYRAWDPYRSKLACCVFKKMEGIPTNLDTMNILYLGASTGTTVSHVSDILGQKGGIIYALEFSIRPARRLIQLSQNRSNIIPIVADARFPERYLSTVWGIDFIFQDISQMNQAEIFVENVDTFLKPGGKAILIVKIKSIDTVAPDEEVVAKQIEYLEKSGLTILEVLDISEFEKAHRAILISKP